jgi:hypothetical protein
VVVPLGDRSGPGADAGSRRRAAGRDGAAGRGAAVLRPVSGVPFGRVSVVRQLTPSLSVTWS